nr:cupin domain-containing protein [Allomuricauda sp.]
MGGIVKSKENSEHYHWGENCSGWHLVKSDSLSVIEELMPPGTQETKHLHKHAQQFFRILKGRATFEFENETLEVPAGSGIHIPPQTWHRIRNDQEEHLEFIVISEPTSRGDRIERGETLSGSSN